MLGLRFAISWRLAGVALILGIFSGVAAVERVSAQIASSPDFACRQCHDESQRSLTLPSGEQLPLRIDLPALDASPHGHGGASPVYCTNCHTGQARYRYPHAPNPAQTHVDFRAAVAPVCQDCHYPHQPFHDAETMDGVMPNCVDCHGEHNIARVQDMGEAMQSRCLACHTDQSDAWATEFVAPRPGLGAGADGYAGSTRCNGCHDGLYFSWHETLHARIVQDPASRPQAIVADFNAEDPDLTFTFDDVRYVIGNRHRQVFLAEIATAPLPDTPTTTATLTQTVALTETAVLTDVVPSTETVTGEPTGQPEIPGSSLALLPAQWTIASGVWEPLFDEGDGSAGDAWLPNCAGCHVTGFDPETSTFTEFGVGCESCHGPAAAHAADPQNIKPYARVDDQVCGACHSRGQSPDGHPYPVTYRPGDDLAAHFTFTQASDDLWADGSAKRNRQQYMDWRLGSAMAVSQKVSCTTCHSVHDLGQADSQLNRPLNNLCLECHNDQRALVRHTPFHEKALKERDFLCTDCHMPKLASGAQPFDSPTHSFLQPNPQASVDHGGLEAMPNACNTCHMEQSETPAWAAEMVAYVVAQATPSSARFFGPGPTPTSPPPPTPIASVGQIAEVELTPPFWWLRWLAIGVAGFVIIAGVVYSIRLLRQRRPIDA